MGFTPKIGKIPLKSRSDGISDSTPDIRRLFYPILIKKNVRAILDGIRLAHYIY